MRLLGVDLGDRRIGLAMSDADGKLAGPLKTLIRNGREIEEILKIVKSEDIGMVVVGLPLNMDGSLGEEGKKAQRFAQELHKKSALPVNVWDERLSTFEAERMLREAGKKGAKLKEAIDKSAAAIILQDFINDKSNK